MRNSYNSVNLYYRSGCDLLYTFPYKIIIPFFPTWQALEGDALEVAESLNIENAKFKTIVARESTHWLKHMHGTHAVNLDIPLAVVSQGQSRA